MPHKFSHTGNVFLSFGKNALSILSFPCVKVEIRVAANGAAFFVRGFVEAAHFLF